MSLQMELAGHKINLSILIPLSHTASIVSYTTFTSVFGAQWHYSSDLLFPE